MPNSFEHKTTYFWQEGKANLHDCLQISFEAAKKFNVTKIVIFTGVGEGVRAAYDDFLSQGDYQDIRLIAVTFPHGHPHPDFGPEDLRWMEDAHIPLIRAHLPFNPIRAQYAGHGILGQDFSLLGNILNVFGGGMSLAVQAVLMACDAGLVSQGEHVIAITSDTSILVRSAPTSHLLTDLIVRQIFCKSVFLDISKKEELPSAAAEDLDDDTPKLIEADSPEE